MLDSNGLVDHPKKDPKIKNQFEHKLQHKEPYENQFDSLAFRYITEYISMSGHDLNNFRQIFAEALPLVE